MPGFDILQQPFQYHQPVAPEVPVADNTAAKIISAGTETAVGGFIRMAVARRQAELEEAKQAQDAALTLRAQDIAKENNLLDYKVGLANAASLAAYRSGIGGGGISDPRWRAEQSFLWKQHEKEVAEQRQASVGDLEHKALSDSSYDFINQEKNWVEDPVTAIDKYMDWSGRFGNAVDGRIPIEIKRLDNRANLLKIPVRVGGRLVPEKYELPDNAPVGTKPRYVPPQWTGGELKQVPLAEFVQKWRYHPELRDQMRQELFAAGGNSRIIDKIEKGNPAVVKKTVFSSGIPLVGGRRVPFTGDEVTPGTPTKIIHQSRLNPDVQTNLQKAEKGTFLKPPSEVPTEPYDLTKPYKPGQNPYEDSTGGSIQDQSNQFNNDATLPAPDLPPLAPGSSIESPSGIPGTSAIDYSPTHTDRTLEQARRAYALNPGARDEIMRRLAGMQINPNLLLA